MGLNAELEGFLVVSLEQAVAAPYCGLLLADAGARVIKIERPDGDFARGYDKGVGGQSAIFAWLNRGKESVCLDLDDNGDRTLLTDILARADVFVHNLAPGALDRRGLGALTLRERNPRLINCEITGYGRSGVGASKKAYDFLVQAESGLCAVTGSADAPSRVGISICDIATGLTAFSAILRAIIQRSRTMQGVDLSISMFDVLAEWMNMPLVFHRCLGQAPQRMGLSHALIAPYGAYATRDRSLILIAVQNNREWRNFCEHILKRPELTTDVRFRDNPDRVANRASLDDAINSVFSNIDRANLINELNQARIACAQLSSVEDLSNHELLRNLEIQFGDAKLTVADLPVPTDRARALHVPLLDQHGDAIRREFATTMAR